MPLVAPGLDLPDIYPPTYIPGHTSYLDACVLAFDNEPSGGLPEGTEWVPACSTAIEQDIFKREVAEQIPGRNLSSNPPKIADMTVFPLDPTTSEGNAVLEVMFEETLPDTMNFVWQRTVKTMRDDGQNEDQVAHDGIYSVVLEVDFASLPAPEEGEEGISVPILGRDMGAQGVLPTGEVDLSALENPEPLLKTCGPVEDHDGTNPDCPMHPEKNFMIRQINVVNNPERTDDPCHVLDAGWIPDGATGPWNFGYLMSEMVKGQVDENGDPIEPSDFARAWLNNWHQPPELVNDQEIMTLSATDINGEEITLANKLFETWRDVSREALNDPTSDELLLALAPFRLSAIVNRFDLRNNAMWGGGKLAGGELRFVFSVLDLRIRELSNGACGLMNIPQAPPEPFRKNHTVILEYAVDLKDQDAVQAWVDDWAVLNEYELFDPTSAKEYFAALENITEQVVTEGRGTPIGNRANGSTLRQIRTNETVDEVRWDLREFVIEDNQGGGFLIPETVKKTPADVLNESDVLGRWISDNKQAYLDDTKPVPDVPPTIPENEGYPDHPVSGADYFLGAQISNADGSVWLPNPNGQWLDYTLEDHRNARHKFSLNTCNACHFNETGNSFAHVRPRQYNEQSFLSNFLTGLPPDPGSPQAPVYVPDPAITTLPNVNFLSSILWTGSQYIAVGGNKSVISPDGFNYSTNDVIPNLINQTFLDVAWSQSLGIFVVVGFGGRIYTSSNGFIWEDRSSIDVTDNLRSVAWNGSYFVAVGFAGTILSSPDGISWSVVASPTTNSLNDVIWAYNNFPELGRWIATGFDGVVISSVLRSGTFWQTMLNGTGPTFNALAVRPPSGPNPAEVIVVGDGGSIITSGIELNSWENQNSGTTESLQSVTWIGESLIGGVAVGGNGTIIISPTVENWTVRDSRTTDLLTSVIWNGSELAVVGSGGLFLTAPLPSDPNWVLGGTGERFRYFEDLRLRLKVLNDCLNSSLQACSEGSPTALSFQPLGRVH